MFHNTKSSFTRKAEEAAEHSSTESSQQSAAFTARTQVGISLAKQAQEARERAKIQQAFQDIAQGTTTLALGLAAASELRESSPTLLFDTVSAQQFKAPPSSSSTPQQLIEDKITPDNPLKELDEDIKDLENELSRLDATNDTSETTYNAWLKQQQDQLDAHAEPTAAGVFKLDSYEDWKTKITNYQQVCRNKLLPELADAQKKYQLSYDELKLAQRDYDVALRRKYVELTKDQRMSMTDATEYLSENFKEKTFYNELYDKEIKLNTQRSTHALASMIPKLVKGEDVSLSLEADRFYTNPTPPGISSIIIEHSKRSLAWFVERSGVNKDDKKELLYGSGRIAARALSAPTKVMVGIEALGLVLNKYKIEDEKEKFRNQTDIAFKAARIMIPLEAGSDVAKVNALFTQLNECLMPFQKIEVHSSIRDPARIQLLENQKAQADACKKINDYNQQHKSYAQPQFY